MLLLGKEIAESGNVKLLEPLGLVVVDESTSLNTKKTGLSTGFSEHARAFIK